LEIRNTNLRSNFSRVEKLAYVAYGKGQLPYSLEMEVRQLSGSVQEQLENVRYEAEVSSKAGSTVASAESSRAAYC
jgi:hypothetical protein